MYINFCRLRIIIPMPGSAIKLNESWKYNFSQLSDLVINITLYRNTCYLIVFSKLNNECHITITKSQKCTVCISHYTLQPHKRWEDNF